MGPLLPVGIGIAIGAAIASGVRHVAKMDGIDVTRYLWEVEDGAYKPWDKLSDKEQLEVIRGIEADEFDL